MYGMGLIGGFCHLYIGQEAVVVGMQMAIKDGDPVITATATTATCSPAAWTQGRDGGADRRARRLFQGKGGSMHMFTARRISTAARHRRRAGAARHRPRLRQPVPQERPRSLTYFGDGAANQGQVYESFNMAELWKAAGRLRSSRTTSTRWAPRSSGPRRTRPFSPRQRQRIPASRSTA
jgi:pyruvate dehydrogenase E1 component alpha subunit